MWQCPARMSGVWDGASQRQGKLPADFCSSLAGINVFKVLSTGDRLVIVTKSFHSLGKY